jgi:EAL domain-containing protein (putative c-di-GMP-specific phosphodiesterase class I)
MGVNISAREFADPELASRIEEALRFSQLEPGAIVLEITEKAITESAEGAVALIARLKDLGVRLHVDDFGTGYSSVRYLRRFPIDALKIDRSYVATMNRNDEAGTIVRSTLSLAHILGLAVVAEGVETDEQVETLREMGCGLAQGMRFAPPLPASGVEALFATLGPGGELPPRSSSPEAAASPSKRAGTGSTAG